MAFQNRLQADVTAGEGATRFSLQRNDTRQKSASCRAVKLNDPLPRRNISLKQARVPSTKKSPEREFSNKTLTTNQVRSESGFLRFSLPAEQRT